MLTKDIEQAQRVCAEVLPWLAPIGSRTHAINAVAESLVALMAGDTERALEASQ